MKPKTKNAQYWRNHWDKYWTEYWESVQRCVTNADGKTRIYHKNGIVQYFDEEGRFTKSIRI